jgi:hypothetical protein
MEDPLTSLRVKDLQDLARTSGLVGYSKLRKTQLIDFLRENLSTAEIQRALETSTTATSTASSRRRKSLTSARKSIKTARKSLTPARKSVKNTRKSRTPARRSRATARKSLTPAQRSRATARRSRPTARKSLLPSRERPRSRSKRFPVSSTGFELESLDVEALKFLVDFYDLSSLPDSDVSTLSRADLQDLVLVNLSSAEIQEGLDLFDIRTLLLGLPPELVVSQIFPQLTSKQVLYLCSLPEFKDTCYGYRQDLAPLFQIRLQGANIIYQLPQIFEEQLRSRYEAALTGRENLTARKNLIISIFKEITSDWRPILSELGLPDCRRVWTEMKIPADFQRRLALARVGVINYIDAEGSPRRLIADTQNILKSNRVITSYLGSVSVTERLYSLRSPSDAELLSEAVEAFRDNLLLTPERIQSFSRDIALRNDLALRGLVSPVREAFICLPPSPVTSVVINLDIPQDQPLTRSGTGRRPSVTFVADYNQVVELVRDLATALRSVGDLVVGGEFIVDKDDRIRLGGYLRFYDDFSVITTLLSSYMFRLIPTEYESTLMRDHPLLNLYLLASQILREDLFYVTNDIPSGYFTLPEFDDLVQQGKILPFVFRDFMTEEELQQAFALYGTGGPEGLRIVMEPPQTPRKIVISE